MRIKAWLATTAAFASLVLINQNCGPGFAMLPVGAITGFGSATVDKNCLDSQADACIFEKSVVAQTGQPASGLTAAQVEAQQTYSVGIGGWLVNGALSNASFTVLSLGASGPLQQNGDAKFRVRASEPEASAKLGQVMSFFWANRTAASLNASAGQFYAGDKSITIVTESDRQGWAPGKNQIHLKTAAGTRSMALDSSLLVYYLGLANLDYANRGAIHAETSSHHASCNTSVASTCCTSDKGCARAIASGQADYLVALMFPQKPLVGDGWVDAGAGQSVCGSSEYFRNSVKAKSLSAAQAFALCYDQGEPGNIYAMGLVYSSMWSSVREAAGQTADAELAQLYMQHLPLLDGDDDFSTAVAKIKKLDQEKFGGRYSPYFTAQATARGL